MSDIILEVIASRIYKTHGWLIKAVNELTEDELCQCFGPTAPPVGWHLWHIARWADRVQASLPRQNDNPNHRADPNHGIWGRARLAEQWGLDPATLGTLEEGSGMDFDTAAALPRRVGKDALLMYAQQVFAATDEAVAALLPEQLLVTRSSVMEYAIDDAQGTIRRAVGAETTLAGDLGFHLSHANRHLGMIEALKGLRAQKGTVTV